MQEKIIEIIANQLETENEKINSDSLISEDLGAHSLDIVEIITDIEDTLSITIPDEVIPDFRTVGDIVNYLESVLTDI